VQYDINPGSAPDIAELKALWLQMLSHHRDLVGERIPVRADAESWERVQNDYGDWLTNEAGILQIARRQGTAEPLGYAVCRLQSGGATFDLGAPRGNVDSLVVHDQARGHGIGTALLEAVRASLEERGVRYWSIGVLTDNAEAAKLYERVGFRPWTQELLASTRAR
jgi:ribosomal protein S18 acetylase RimI-like enzyme